MGLAKNLQYPLNPLYSNNKTHTGRAKSYKPDWKNAAKEKKIPTISHIQEWVKIN